MVLWFVLPSVPSLAFGTGAVGDVLNEELVRVVYQLLGVSHLQLMWRMTFKASITVLLVSLYFSWSGTMSVRPAITI